MSNEAQALHDLANLTVSSTVPAAEEDGSPLTSRSIWLDRSATPWLWKRYDPTVPEWVVFGQFDTVAIHGNVAGEIAAIAEKASPVDGDWVLIEDSEASNAKKRAQLGNLPGGSGGGGGASELPAWAQDNVAASQTDVALTLLGDGRETVRALADGDLTAVLVESTEARTAGTCTVTVQVNGSDTALTATLDGTNTEWHKGTGTVAVTEGDEVGVLVTTDGSWAPTTAEITVRVQAGTSGSGGAASDLLHARDEKTSGTNGGSFNNGAWRTRTLNTEVTNEITGASLSSDEITLPAGTYEIEASAPAYRVGRHKARLFDVTGSAVLVEGISVYNQEGSSAQVTLAWVRGRFTLSTTSAVRLEHRCQFSSATIGLGVASSFGTEVYADLMIRTV